MKLAMYLLLFSFLSSNSVFPQSVGINSDASPPDSSAILDVKSDNKGILVPRMTQSQRISISGPAVGLLVFQTDAAAGFYFYTGSTWKALNDEIDPVFNASVAKGITSADIANWNKGFSSRWSLEGNSGLSEATNFLGTTDNVGLILKTNGLGRLSVAANGNVGIGLSANASQKLEVGGNIALARSLHSASRYELHLNRGRLNFSSAPNDNNHVIYNNGNNVDGEGIWDGIKINCYNGLNVRVGNAGATSALFINSSGQIGIGAPTSYADMLNIVGGVAIKSLSSNYYVILKGGSSSSNVSFTLPDSRPSSAGMFLTADPATGNMSWLAGSYGLSGVLAVSPNAGGGAIVNVSNIAVGTATPNASAALDVSSTTQGFLPPRMTTAQIAAIANPAEGLIVYNTEQKKIKFFDGTSWTNIDGTHNVGDRFGGGIIFWLDASGQHGMVCSESDQSSEIPFGALVDCGGMREFSYGKDNTTRIVAANGEGTYAAKLCADLTLNGYDDWYLPSLDEMAVIQTALYDRGLGNFTGYSKYWTSTDLSVAAYAFVYKFYVRASLVLLKNVTNSVRAIRSF